MVAESKKPTKKLTVEVSENVYWQFKQQCAARRTSMSEVLAAFVEHMVGDAEDDLDDGLQDGDAEDLI